MHLFLYHYRLVPRELALSVEPWIHETLPPNNSTTNSTSIASTAQLSQQQSKIMNVVVPNVACTPAATKKIRRKPENKVSSPHVSADLEKKIYLTMTSVLSCHAYHKFYIQFQFRFPFNEPIWLSLIYLLFHLIFFFLCIFSLNHKLINATMKSDVAN